MRFCSHPRCLSRIHDPSHELNRCNSIGQWFGIFGSWLRISGKHLRKWWKPDVNSGIFTNYSLIVSNYHSWLLLPPYYIYSLTSPCPISRINRTSIQPRKFDKPSPWNVTWRQWWKVVCQPWLGGGSKDLLLRTLGKYSNLTHTFQIGWNYQLDHFSGASCWTSGL